MGTEGGGGLFECACLCVCGGGGREPASQPDRQTERKRGERKREVPVCGVGVIAGPVCRKREMWKGVVAFNLAAGQSIEIRVRGQHRVLRGGSPEGASSPFSAPGAPCRRPGGTIRQKARRQSQRRHVPCVPWWRRCRPASLELRAMTWSWATWCRKGVDAAS